MSRAGKPCSTPGCSSLEPCADHPRGPWAGSARDQGQRISGGRRQTRARFILTKYDTICHVCQYPGAQQVDHVIPLSQGGADDESNLRPIHADPCHRLKTENEAQAGRRLETT